jgi:hypothetical protein
MKQSISIQTHPPFWILLPLLLLALQGMAAPGDSLLRKTKPAKTDFFNAGFIDLVSSGQVSAAARLIRLMIGEPGKWAIPLTVYGGVSNAAFPQQNAMSYNRNNEHLIAQFITPLSGLLNFSVEGLHRFPGTKEYTQWGLLYQVGERILTGTQPAMFSNPYSARPHNFLNSYAVGGFYFQTGAWERDRNGQLGICWMSARIHLCYTDPKQLAVFLNGENTSGVYAGYSLGFGIEISYLVHIKAIYYRYTKAPEPAYGWPLYQFSFNYALPGKN